MKKTSPQNAVNNLGGIKARTEMRRRGLTNETLARQLGITEDTLANILSGTNRGDSTKLKIESILGLPCWSSPQEFAARQREAGNSAIHKPFLSRFAETLASFEQDNAELQAVMSGCGFSIVCAQLEGGPHAAIWNFPDSKEPFNGDLLEARAGHFDAAEMREGFWFVFYVATDLPKALDVLKRSLKLRGLSDHARLFVIEKSGWRVAWPETNEIVNTR